MFLYIELFGFFVSYSLLKFFILEDSLQHAWFLTPLIAIFLVDSEKYLQN